MIGERQTHSNFRFDQNSAQWCSTLVFNVLEQCKSSLAIHIFNVTISFFLRHDCRHAVNNGSMHQRPTYSWPQHTPYTPTFRHIRMSKPHKSVIKSRTPSTARTTGRANDGAPSVSTRVGIVNTQVSTTHLLFCTTFSRIFHSVFSRI